MTARLAILCSGQGGQHPGMYELARSNAAAAQLLDGSFPTWADADDLFANRIAQPALVAAACAAWIAIRDDLPRPVAVAGYSVGEVAALAVAGVLAPEDAVQLAQVRARLMDACVDPRRPQGLIAVSGLPLATVRSLLAARSGLATQIAIINGPDQCILGGLCEDGPDGQGIDALAGTMRSAGAQVSRLPVAIASHTHWMQAALTPLEEHAMRLSMQPPTARLLAGTNGEAAGTAAAAISALVRQTVQTVRWDACMDALAEAGITVALELGPGNALSRMLAARHPGVACRSVADFRSIAGIGAWVARH